jgi:HlyD family secretion protein
MSVKKPLVAGAVALLIVAVAFITWRSMSHRHDAALRLYGNVDVRSVDLGFRVPGRIGEIRVDEGAKVRQGEVLALLDQQPLNDALHAAQAQLANARAQLSRLQNGNRPQDIAQAEAQLADRVAAVAQARAEYQRRSELIKTGAVSQAQFDASQAQFLAAQAQQRAAEQALSLQRVGARHEDIEAAQAQLAAATAERDKAQTDLADASLVAPADGTIFTRAREPGAIALAGETVFVLTVDRPLRVRAYVAEQDLSRISPGMAVNVSADGNARVYRGIIGFISPAAEFTPKTVQTESLRTDLVYRLRVIVDDPDDALRQGQPVTVSVPDARPAGARHE